MKHKGDKIARNILSFCCFKYEVLICSVGFNLLDVNIKSFYEDLILKVKLKFLCVCNITNVPGLIYSYENINHPLEEQLEFAEKNDLNIIVIIKEKVFIKYY